MNRRRRGAAELKARHARVAASARANPLPQLVAAPFPGWSAWLVGKAVVLMPRLLPGAPNGVRRLYLARVICNATGECPNCGAVVSIKETGKDVINGRGDIPHESECPLPGGEEKVGPWLDPAGEDLRRAMVRGG